ncbi:MetQ/NlpA family ABC transporter substrate-binding protein [Subtercola sp. YIM 133946]|uniref:MetQ/NlpA family ABC transporter substrate-binding protein n=1 Tax=Subtercola sp. YIM 133946 TaxID=3118909 RepID=UPI002F957C8A
MHAKRILIAAAAAASFALVVSGCAGSSSSSSTAAVGSTSGAVTTLKVGATFPADDILNYVEQTQAAAAGIDIQVTSFTDYTTPNTALEDGSLDANLYQHLPFLNNFNTQNGTHIAPVGKVYFPALALYSKTIKSVDDIKDGDTISIPNDPTNELRSLNLLAKAGLITVKDGATGTIEDIDQNPKNLKFQELDAATLPRALDENAAGVVNLTYALPAGLTGDEQIFKEDVDGTKYTNLLATKEGHENDPAIQTLYSLLTSKQTQDWITSQYKGLVTPASGPAQ